MMKLTDAIRHAEEIAEKCDLISEASKTIKTHISYRKCAEEHRQLADWLKELQRYQWIPCSERLPSERGEYLVSYIPCYWDEIRGDVKVGVDTFRGKSAWAKKKFQRVIAWMPLPKAYEPEEADE